MPAQPVQEELDFSIVSAKLTIEAMRDSGYKSTDHALAELIDNSVEAGANLVEIVSIEEPPDPNQRYGRPRVTEIAVSDDGEGMDRHTLRCALRFGDGTRLDRSARGIGRFGVGLPQSSISQCRRVDVWTWQNGSGNALHCYLDLNESRPRAARRFRCRRILRYPTDGSPFWRIRTNRLAPWSCGASLIGLGGAEARKHWSELRNCVAGYTGNS